MVPVAVLAFDLMNVPAAVVSKHTFASIHPKPETRVSAQIMQVNKGVLHTPQLETRVVF